MGENTLTIIIDKPIKEVFKFTIDPSNTPLWAPHIKKETADPYPPTAGSIYKSKKEASDTWDELIVSEIEENKTFELRSEDNSFYVRYEYSSNGVNQTNLDYTVYLKDKDFDISFIENLLNNLKKVLENS